MIGRFGLVIFSIHMPIGTRAMFLRRKVISHFLKKEVWKFEFFSMTTSKRPIFMSSEKKLVESQTFTLVSFYALPQPIGRKALYSKNFRNFAFSLPGTAGNWNFFLRIAREERYFAKLK
jgi:hypothetical protein